MTITGKTMLLGIFGDPVAHSLSPLMQNAALAAAGIDAVYVPFHVLPEQLRAAVGSLGPLGIRGVNVTIPHKETILPLLGEIADEARLIGAVNTVVQQGGSLTGYNTDAPGFLRSLREDLDFDCAGSNVLLVGAGGAGRAAAVALLRNGVASLAIANRSLPRAEQLARELAGLFPHCTITSCALEGESLRRRQVQADLLVNSSALGLHGEAFQPDFLCDLAAEAAVYDMVYRRGTTTPLVLAARAVGRRAADGLGMLAAQGEEAFRLWTGVAPPAGLMKSRLLAECLEK